MSISRSVNIYTVHAQATVITAGVHAAPKNKKNLPYFYTLTGPQISDLVCENLREPMYPSNESFTSLDQLKTSQIRLHSHQKAFSDRTWCSISWHTMASADMQLKWMLGSSFFISFSLACMFCVIIYNTCLYITVLFFIHILISVSSNLNMRS